MSDSVTTIDGPKRRGRPLGSKSRTPKKPYAPRAGSRPYALLQMMSGDRIYLESPGRDRTQAFMQQIAADIGRTGLQGKVTQTLVLGIIPDSRAVIDLVMVTRK